MAWVPACLPTPCVCTCARVPDCMPTARPSASPASPRAWRVLRARSQADTRPRRLLRSLQGVLLVLGQQDTSWNNMKKFLGSKAVKDEVRPAARARTCAPVSAPAPLASPHSH